MKAHPAAEAFPLIEGAEFEALVADIRARGLVHPIVIYNNQILDGRNRYKACRAASVEARFCEYDGNDPVGYVVSTNIARRHMDESQRAMVAAKLANLFEGRPAKTAQNCAVSQTDAAHKLNVGRRTVQQAAAVLERGAPELVRAVEQGKVAVSAAVKIAERPKEEQARIVRRVETDKIKPAHVVAELHRTDRLEKLAEIAQGNAPLTAPPERFPVLYADPPWRYEHVETESRAIENQYPTMSLDDICALPVGNVLTDDAILFLWVTSPKLEEGMRVVREWGFTYRTCMVWDKEKIGMGYYARQQHELLLICTKGTPPTPAPGDRPPSVIRVARAGHSAKPVEFYELIERMYPSLPKLEMFCRAPREGWSVWGNQSRAA